MRSYLTLICLLAVLHPAVTLAADVSSTIKQIDQQVAKKEDWLKDAKLCPSSLVPKDRSTDHLAADTCRTDPASCYSRCDSGDGGSCYWLANAVQQGGGKVQTSEALFQRACKLGIVSGCTNRAAGMDMDAHKDKAVQRCTARTFAKTCSLDDPWGCTMYALHLSRGLGVKANPDLALRTLEKSCKYGADDPACGYARKIREDIEKRKKAAPSK